MRRRTKKWWSTLLVGALLAAPAAAAPLTVQVVAQAPPAEVAPAIAATLEVQAIEVRGPQGVLCQIWLRKPIPALPQPAQTLGVVYGDLEPGTLVGVMRLPAPAVDFRNQKIPAGVYTLRYALHPVDGNHQGVAPDRDFLLASPAAADTSVATLAFQPLVQLSRKATGTNHPSVWCLLPAESVPANLPAVHEQESDAGPLEVLWVRATIERNGQTAPLVLALVVEGISPAA